MNIQDWFPLGWTGAWSPCSPRDSQESFPKPQFKSINSLALSFPHCPTLTFIHDHWKNIALTRQTFVDKVMNVSLNMLSRLVITFLPRSKHLLISWLQSPSAVILEPRKIKSSTVSPSICHGKFKALTERKETASKSVNLELLTIGMDDLAYLQRRKLLYQLN